MVPDLWCFDFGFVSFTLAQKYLELWILIIPGLMIFDTCYYPLVIQEAPSQPGDHQEKQPILQSAVLLSCEAQWLGILNAFLTYSVFS
jgi:hypothetical protein